MKTANEILNTLPSFTGTEGYVRIAPNAVLTDGTAYLADAAECYWLFQDCATFMVGYEKGDGFAVIQLTISEDNSFKVLRGDGNDNWTLLWSGEYTDFPLRPEFEFFAGFQPDIASWVFLLKSEY